MSHSQQTSNERTQIQTPRARAAGLSAQVQVTKILGVPQGVLVSILSAGLLTVGVSAARAEQAPQTPTAAPTAENSDEELSEIIVTARRVEERAQDVPISMTIFSQQQLSDRNIVNAEDLAAFTPGLSADNQFGSNVTTFSIRGFVQSLNTTPSVAVYFGDAVVPRGGNVSEPAGAGIAPGEMFDLQNIQVLKGPQGTLFGRNTDGGAVLLVPKKPGTEFEAYVEGTYGNYADGRVEAVLNIPVTDNFRVRFGVNHETRNGYIENVSGVGPTNFDDVGYTAVRLSAVLDITPQLENYTIGTYNISLDNGPLPQLFACNNGLGPFNTPLTNACPTQLAQTAAAGPYAAENDLPGAESYLRQYQLINTTTWRPSDRLTVKNIYNYGQLLTSFNEDIEGSNFFVPLNGLPTHVFSAISDARDEGVNTTDQYTVSDEFQLQGNAFADKLIWQGGYYYERSAPLGLTGSRSPTDINCTNIAKDQCSDPLFSLFGTPFGAGTDSFAYASYDDWGIFAQGTYALTSKLKLTAGARYTRDTSDATIDQTVTVFFLDPPLNICSPVLGPPLGSGAIPRTGCVQSFHKDSSAPTWTTDLQYFLTDDLMTYVKYSRGYREGSVATLNIPEAYHTFNPERVDTYEAGEKATFHGENLSGTFNVTGFFNNFTQQQLLVGFIPTGAGTPGASIENAGKSHIYGAEVESAVTPWKPLTLGLSYTYLRTELLSANPTAAPGFTVLLPTQPGDPLPFSPKNKLAANAVVKLPAPQHLGNVSLGATYVFTGQDFLASDTPFGTVAHYSLVNMNLKWDNVVGSPVDAEFFVTNLANTLYYSNVSQVYNVATFGLENRIPGEPRMFGARIRVRFGGK